LAVEMHAALVLMDDRRGRREAEARGLSVAGTLNVLEAAAKRDLVDLPTAIAKLRQTNFHVAESIIQRALQEDADRRGKKND
jgi:predicted nucleic acid-binding protein